MKNKFSNPNSSGFTLIEIITVIAIVSILTAILIPTASKAIESAHKAKASHNLRQIALAYLTYFSQTDSYKPQSTTIHDWVAELSSSIDFNKPDLWILKHDPLVEQSPYKFPKTIFSKKNKNLNAVLASDDFRKFPLSFTLVSGLSPHSPASTTPVAWTRGLLSSGKWSSLNNQNPGVYGNKGGYIAFLDGHVEWFSDLTKNGGCLTNYLTGEPTSNIYESISPGALVLDFPGEIGQL